MRPKLATNDSRAGVIAPDDGRGTILVGFAWPLRAFRRRRRENVAQLPPRGWSVIDAHAVSLTIKSAGHRPRASALARRHATGKALGYPGAGTCVTASVDPVRTLDTVGVRVWHAGQNADEKAGIVGHR